MDKCPICGSPSLITDISNDFNILFKVNCLRCGKYKIKEEVIEFEIENDELSPEQIANISGLIRENQDILIDSKKFKSLMTIKTLSVSEKANLILNYLGNKYPIAGTEIEYSFDDLLTITIRNEKNEESWTIPDDLFPIFGIGNIVSSKELRFIWEEYLIKTKEYISSEQPRIITPAGWAYLESLRQSNPESKKAFVAMWFDTEMEKIYDGFIKKAIKSAGFEPIQIGRKEHNNDINDEIIGEIRNSKFVVADFTGNRGGVYYEAGFAYGLNIEVIHTCKEDQLKDVHFDINHRKIIKWSDGEDLYNKLLKRIKATIT